MGAKTFAIIVSAAILVFVVGSIRKKKMTFKYSMFWLTACVLVMFLALFDGLLVRLTKFAGFQLPSNFIFFIAVIFFIALSLLLTIYVNEQNSRSEKLAQAVGILEYKIKKMEARENPAPK